LIGLVIVHFLFLHTPGSSNPLGTKADLDKVNFHPYFSRKDATPLLLVIIVVTMLVTQMPLLLGDRENSNEANPLTTPLHIQPEWYFLFAYAILRSIPSKVGGVVALAASVLRFLLPIINNIKKNTKKVIPSRKLIVWLLVRRLLILTWIGANPVEPPYETVGQIFRLVFFILIINTIFS